MWVGDFEMALNLDRVFKSCLIDIEYINATTIKAIIDDEEDNTLIQLALKPEVCCRCSGTGKTLYGSLEGMAFTQSDFDEDPDFREELMDGVYDVPCPDCMNTGVVLTLDKNENPKEIVERIMNYAELKLELAREDAYNRRMGY